ncbi:MAG: hypothetical protein R3349_09530 [Geminicoccaceae bacterium]|nr:hypothetical protein [Geminicoccaceae bacterium]
MAGVSASLLLAGCTSITGPGLFADDLGQTTGACDAKFLTVESADGNVRVARGETERAELNQNVFSWYCGELREDNLGKSRCPEGTNYIEISRNFVGPEFVARCIEQSSTI